MEYFFSLTFSLLISILLGYFVIPILRSAKAKQTTLSYVTMHSLKSGTTTMGGIIFIVAIALSFFVFKQPQAKIGYVVLGIAGLSGAIGFFDDYKKITQARNEGLSPMQKIFFQVLVGAVLSFYVYKFGTKVILPISLQELDLGVFIIPLTFIAYISVVNTVNLTDGLDGLVSSISIIYLVALFALMLLTSYLKVNAQEFYVSNKNILTIISLAVGSLCGFLVFNNFPAKIFMGDTGSLFLGGLIASVSALSGNLLLIPLLGIGFVVSGISDIIQVFYFKLTKGKRVFLIAPFHHHLEKKGLHENKIVGFYTIITIIVSLLIINLTLVVY